MKLSIVIPTYQEGKYLERCLASLKESVQGFDHEIIVVDSYSKDNTVEIAKKYGAKIIQVPKGNIGLARDEGFKTASGDILISASADNIFPPDYIKKLIQPIREGNAEVVMGAVELPYKNPLQKIPNKTLNHIIIPAVFMLNMTFSVGDSMAFKREVYEKIGFPRTPTAEDTLFIKKVKRERYRIKYHKEAVLYTSDRRLKQWGILKFMVMHSKNFINANFFEKYEENYEVIR